MVELTGNDFINIAALISTNCSKENNQFIAYLSENECSNKIKIEKIICNYPASNSFENNDGFVDEIENSIASLGVEVLTANSGDEFMIGSLKFKVLNAPDKQRYAEIKDSSLVIKISNDKHSVIFTGEMTDRISEKILANYREDLKCDFVQVANHGWNNGGVLEFYKACSADIQLWNNSEYAFRFFSPNEGYGKSEISTAVYKMVRSENNVFCDHVKPQILIF